MRVRTSTWVVLAAWTLLVGGYAAVALLATPGRHLTAFGDIMQCLVPLFANAGLLMNAGSTHWRRNGFWMLLALGCSMWMAGQLIWTHYELVLHQPVPNPFAGDVIFFLHTVPMIGALALQPHARVADRSLRFGYLDFLLLLSWWVYLYAFVVLPWQYLTPDASIYGDRFNNLYWLENLILIAGMGVLWLRTTGPWRKVYAHLFAASTLYSASSLTINVAIDIGRYHTGSIYDVPLIASFVWFGTAGMVAFRNTPASDPAPVEASMPRALRGSETAWAARLAMAAVLSLPALTAWNLAARGVPELVQEFRTVVTMVAMVGLTALVFLRQHLVNQERHRLFRASQESLDNLRRLQTSFAQSEKMAALGQLAAGAAREINNPLTAILGYSDLIKDEPDASQHLKALGAKIQEQARRTKVLVTNLLSFARQMPAEKSFIDIHSVLKGALQLRTLDLREQNIRLELHSESVLPGVRGDPNQLLQVFYNLVSNAVDAMEETRGGLLTVRAMREKSKVVIEFSDTGPGMKEPSLVFDPFYSTKAVGKGNGLGLSICYGILQEHGGNITAYNRPEGGATFRVELPAVAPVLPKLAPADAPSAPRPVPMAAPVIAPSPTGTMVSAQFSAALSGGGPASPAQPEKPSSGVPPVPAIKSA